MKNIYSEKAMKQFLNPKNLGEIKNPDGEGKSGKSVCGDMTFIYIKKGPAAPAPELEIYIFAYQARTAFILFSS